MDHLSATKEFIILLFLLSFIFTFQNCQTDSISNALRKIDTLQNKLNEIEFMIGMEEEISRMLKEIDSNINIINTMNRDTLNFEESQKWSDYYSIKIIYEKYLSQTIKTKNELDLSKVQIYNLKQDIEAKSISEGEFQNYYRNETDIISLTLTDKKKYYDILKIQKKRLIELRPFIKSHISKIMVKNMSRG